MFRYNGLNAALPGLEVWVLGVRALPLNPRPCGFQESGLRD